jgi:hypothetical protein
MNESPFRSGTRNKNDFSKAHEMNKYDVEVITTNFTSKKYTISKSKTSMFVTKGSTKTGKYLMSIEYEEQSYNKQKALVIELAHSDEPKLFGKFVFHMLKYYKYITSGDNQSTQAEKSWKNIINKAQVIYKTTTSGPVKIHKDEIESVYNTKERLVISEDVISESPAYFEDTLERKKKSSTFVEYLTDNMEGDYLFPLQIDER